MSASNEWTEWHLTPRGWIAGDTQLDGPRYDRPTPDDRVMTCEYREFVSSPFSPLEITVTVRWVGDSARAAALEAKFGECPRELAFRRDQQTPE